MAKSSVPMLASRTRKYPQGSSRIRQSVPPTSVIFKAKGQPAVQTTMTAYGLEPGDKISNFYAIDVSGGKVLYGHRRVTEPGAIPAFTAVAVVVGLRRLDDHHHKAKNKDCSTECPDDVRPSHQLVRPPRSCTLWLSLLPSETVTVPVGVNRST